MNEKEKVNQITEGVIWKQLLLFFFPIVFGTFFQQIYNTADTIVVGRFVVKQALAAVRFCQSDFKLDRGLFCRSFFGSSGCDLAVLWGKR